MEKIIIVGMLILMIGSVTAYYVGRNALSYEFLLDFYEEHKDCNYKPRYAYLDRVFNEEPIKVECPDHQPSLGNTFINSLFFGPDMVQDKLNKCGYR